jgi:2-polyprenyl-3-methyl-5-hydroxy-6-metoxy-1,4-benzoquinol methylase
MPDVQQCWCGNSLFSNFSDDYYLCAACGTLVLKYWPDNTLAQVKDEGELYSRDYYLRHLVEDYGFPDLPTRTRDDLGERNTYWLRTLLKYRLPPGKSLELGCAHGGFVALMQQCGFDANGLELSPWLVEYAQTTFDVPMLKGTLEEQSLPENSLDVIALMDVLEHLPDPLDTMSKALSLLKPNGLLLIQTPRYRESVSYDELEANQDRFLIHFKPLEHLFLFSERAVHELFRRLDAVHLLFEPPIFDYDMFFLVSRQPFEAVSRERRDAELQSIPRGRIMLGLLDLYERMEMFQKESDARLQAIEYLKQESAQRLEVINKLSQSLVGKQQGRIEKLVRRFMRGRSP